MRLRATIVVEYEVDEFYYGSRQTPESIANVDESSAVEDLDEFLAARGFTNDNLLDITVEPV